MLIQCPRVFRTISAVLCGRARFVGAKHVHSIKDSLVSWDVSRWISTRPTASAGIKPPSVYFTRSPCTRFLDIVAFTEARKQPRRRATRRHSVLNLVRVKSVARALACTKMVHSRGHHALQESCLKGTHTETDKARRSHRTTQNEDKATPKVSKNIEAACGDPSARFTGFSVIQRTAHGTKDTKVHRFSFG